MTEAKVIIYSNGKYEIKILSGIFNFIVEEFDTADKHPIQEFAQKTGEEIAAQLKEAEGRFLDQFSLQSDQGTAILIEKVS